MLIIRTMIPKKSLLFLSALLTLALLVACEPLAPEQTPNVVVVTGETPDAASATPVAAAINVTPAPDGTLPASTPAANAGGVVNTPVPSRTPTPQPTPTPSVTPFVCNEAKGRVIELSLDSGTNGEPIPYLMYQPPCFYDTLKRYPYVILLHGTGYDEQMWTDMGIANMLDEGLAAGTLPPMVVIMPDGGYLAELNDRGETASFETVIVDELIPSLEESFCLWDSRQGRAIGGISRGGFWAFSVALRHPDLFSALGGHSPHFDNDNAPPEINPLSLASRVNLKNYPLRIYMDNSANDYVSTNAIKMSELLTGNSIEHDYVINPTGNHDTDYWGAHLAEYLTFYGQTWPQDIDVLPSCLEPTAD